MANVEKHGLSIFTLSGPSALGGSVAWLKPCQAVRQGAYLTAHPISATYVSTWRCPHTPFPPGLYTYRSGDKTGVWRSTVQKRSLYLSSPHFIYYPAVSLVVHRLGGRPRDAPWNWVTAVGRWGSNQAESAGGCPWPKRYGLTRASPFLPGPLSLPYQAFQSPAMTRMGRKRLNSIVGGR